MGVFGQGAGPADSLITFQFDRPALRQPGYTFEVHRDGRAAYTQAGVSVPLEVSTGLAARIFEEAVSVARFDFPCASKKKGIADTGLKTLAYKGQDGAGSCTYNYTESKTVQTLTDQFQGMALMLEEGRKLEMEHKYDRLALYGEMTTLEGMVKDGRAIEVGLIAKELWSLVGDPDVLEKVRVKAGDLLKTMEIAR